MGGRERGRGGRGRGRLIKDESQLTWWLLIGGFRASPCLSPAVVRGFISAYLAIHTG